PRPYARPPAEFNGKIRRVPDAAQYSFQARHRHRSETAADQSVVARHPAYADVRKSPRRRDPRMITQPRDSAVAPLAILTLQRSSGRRPQQSQGSTLVLRVVLRFFGFLFSWAAIGSIMALAGLVAIFSIYGKDLPDHAQLALY